MWKGAPLPWWLRGKESTCQCRGCRRRKFDPWVGTNPWRRAWLPTPVFLPGECHGKRNRADYSPWGRKELHMTDTHTTQQQPFFFSFSLLCVCRDRSASQWNIYFSAFSSCLDCCAWSGLYVFWRSEVPLYCGSFTQWVGLDNWLSRFPG